MIFRDYLGKIIEINRLDFKNDKLYYNKIMQIKKQELFYNMNIKFNDNTQINQNYSTYIINKTIN